jgi:hypothetical protein
MLPYLHYQQRSTTCAVAGIRTVLHWQFGIRVSESALVLLGTRPDAPIIKNGSDVHDMRRMVREASARFTHDASWTLRVRTQGTLGQLRHWVRRGRWPLVQVFVPENLEHHIIVVTDVVGDRVQYFDPDPSGGRGVQWMDEAPFLDWWCSPVSNERWWAVVNGGVLIARP